tara:strand:- start:1476 stop:1592 length:117 start_codon:yes stop_codon:yes gene_type:complete
MDKKIVDASSKANRLVKEFWKTDLIEIKSCMVLDLKNH